MKKFLSLVLALVMTMSLVTISAGAKDFTDTDKVTYTEAVDVISTVKVVDGYTDGSFNPQATLTRGAAAKIICNLILGPTTAAELPASVAPFKDVPANSTFAGYIAYCAKEGIVGGYADGTFKPGATLTGYAFMKMLLGTLGYDAEIEGYNIPGTWSVSVAKQALGIGLNKGLAEDFDGTKPVTREEACLYALNTLKATLVDYETKTTVNVGDASVTIAGTTAKPVGWDNKNTQTGIKNDGNIDKDGFVQFAEQFFPKLEAEATTDVFGRPSRTWTYKGEEIDTYVNYDLLVAEYTEKVTGKDLYDLLGRSVVEDKDYTFNIYVDGETKKDVLGDAYFNSTYMNKNNKSGVGGTGDGVQTQVFVDSEDKVVNVVVINTYLAKATADYSEKKDSVTFEVFKLDDAGDKQYVKTKASSEKLTVSGEDFVIDEVKKDDIVWVNVAEGEIQVIGDVEVVEDVTLASFSKGKYVMVGNDKYSYADTAEYKDDVLDKYTSVDSTINLKELTYNIYVDANGYLLGIDLVEVPNNYVFITGYDHSSSALATKTADAFAIFVDGTTETIKVNTEKSVQDDGTSALITAGASRPHLETWCTYTVDKNGVYTLKQVAENIGTGKVGQYKTAGSYEIDKKHVSLPGAVGGQFAFVYGNDSTVYLHAKLTKISAADIIISGVQNVTTGVKNANLTSYTAAQVKNSKTEWNTFAGQTAAGVYNLYKENGYIIASVVVGKDDAASKNLVYVNSDDVSLESYGSDEWTWTREVIIDGVKTELKEKGDTLTYISAGAMTEGGWYQVQYNADGYVIGKDTAASALGADYQTTVAAAVARMQTAGVDTVLYRQAIADAAKAPYLKGSTLYTDTTAETGFFVAEDVKTVLIQKNDNKKTTSYEDGVDKLEDILGSLNKAADGKYDYTASVILDEGAAKYVIIVDKNDETGKKGDDTATETLDSSTLRVDLRTPQAIKVYSTKSATEFLGADAANAISAQLVKDGYTIISANFDGTDTYTWVAKKPGDSFNTNFKFKNDASGLFTGAEAVTLNGKTVVYKSTGTITQLLGDQNLEAAGNGYVKLTKKADGKNYFEQSNSSYDLAAGDKLTTGYLKVQVGSNTNLTGYSAKIDIDSLEQATGAASTAERYALATATFTKGTEATGTGLKVDTNTYVPYTATYGDINDNDDNATDGIAKIADFNQVALTVVNDTVGSTSTTVTAQAYNATAANISSLGGIAAAGTMMSVDGDAFVLETTPVTLNKDVTVKVGYVKVTSLTATMGASGITAAWNVAANDVVKVGSTITATLTLPTAGIAGDGNKKVTASNVGGAAMTQAATVTGATTSTWATNVYTFKTGDTVKGTLTANFVPNVNDVAPSVVYS